MQKTRCLKKISQDQQHEPTVEAGREQQVHKLNVRGPNYVEKSPTMNFVGKARTNGTRKQSITDGDQWC